MFIAKKTDAAAPDTISVDATRHGSSFGGASSAQSFAAYDRSTPTKHSIVDERLTMKGDLESDGDVLVKGKVIGNIRCKLLIIDTDANVEGGIECEELVVRGHTKGTILATRVRLEKSAQVDSEICHQSFSAEEGARVKGALRYMEDIQGVRQRMLEPKAATAAPSSAAAVAA